MDIFTLTDEEGRLFHPVRQAATFAKYSRSPESARDLVKKTDELSSSKFQKKWIVKFGHNAIAELATLPVAFEGVSIIASKAIEAWQRPGVSEKSTRMQEFNRDSLYLPKGIDQEVLDKVTPLVDRCFDLYEDMVAGELKSTLARANPDLSDFQVGRMAFDMARYLLPSGCRTNLGICSYPRDLSRMIAEFRGSPNPELRDIGESLQVAAEGLGGPLIRHTEPDEWVHRIPAPCINKSCAKLKSGGVRLTNTNMLEMDFLRLLEDRYQLTFEDLEGIMRDRPEHHGAPKLFREVQMDFSVYMDYGAFRDLQRHRRMEQFVEYLTPAYGFSIPPGLEQASPDFCQRFVELLTEFSDIPWPTDPLQLVLCQYPVPLAFTIGWHVKMDLEQLYYLVELRTQESGHPSYRSVSYSMWDEAACVYPALTQWIRPRGPRP